LGPSASQVGTDQLVEVLKQAFQSAFLPPSEVKKADSPVVETRELVLRSSSEAPTMLYPPAHEPAATPAVMPEQPTSPSTTVPGTPAVKETMVDETLEDAGGAKNASNLAQLGTVPPEPPTAPSRQLSKEDVKGMSECEILKQYRLGLVPEEFITSKTCKGLYMRLRRQMEKDDADVNFPQMSKMFAGSTKEKLGLLRSFLQNGENAKACETQIRLEKTWEHEYEGKEELLTVREMRTRGIS
ncbi:unnamed protein product, partial [Durusdinium trenchii]